MQSNISINIIINNVYRCTTLSHMNDAQKHTKYQQDKCNVTMIWVGLVGSGGFGWLIRT